MAAVTSQPGIGPLLRDWRKRRRLSQLELALDAGVSARHLSFVESGRSAPSASMVLRLAEHLGVPYRERNQLLLAAGYAPAFPERALDDPEMESVRHGLDLILRRHEPYPAIAVDRAWNVVAANGPVSALMEVVEVDPALLEEPVNAVRFSFHPRGLGPAIVGLEAWRAYFRERLARQYALTGDERLAALIDELAGYPAAEEDDDHSPGPPASGALGLLKLRAADGAELAFFTTFAIFDMPFEVTTSELAIELLFPADERTAERLAPSL